MCIIAVIPCILNDNKDFVYQFSPAEDDDFIKKATGLSVEKIKSIKENM